MNLSWPHLLAFLFAVGLLVTVHEFGHYWVARRLGFKVQRFSVGFGKALWKRVGRDADRVEYVVAAIPLGGYVKLLDEREGPVDPAELHRAFNRRPHWQRILVLLAGPAFNIGFAILLLWALFWINGLTEVRAVIGEVLPESPAAHAGLASGDEILSLDGRAADGRSDVVLGLLDQMTGDGSVTLTLRDDTGAERMAVLEVADPAERRRLTEPENLLTGLGFGFWSPPVPAQLGVVEAGGPAQRAGLQVGDEVLAVNGNTVQDFEALRREIQSRPGQTAEFTFRRGGEQQSLRVEIGAEELEDGRVGRLGIASPTRLRLPDSMLTQTRLGPLDSLAMGADEAWRMTVLQAKVFWRMLQGQVSLKNLSGPLTIAEFAGESARSGVATFVSFLVLISLSLGFINLLPVPILDGGQVVYQLVEWIKGSPLSERAQIVGQQVGIGMLVLLMGVALFNDVLRQFG
ncbi:MAG TPA: RIP metalloprotease RseP [Steroidobacteraceae bacterium]|nr:RIP metalloprotease RseP [Steroidobacteraceae bacterium]